MAIFENSSFSSIPDSNIGGIHVLYHSLATMDSGSSRGGGKVFLIPKFNSVLPVRNSIIGLLFRRNSKTDNGIPVESPYG